VDFNGLATFLRWEDPERDEVRRQIIERTVARLDCNSNVRWATRRIVRATLAEDDPLRLQAEIYILRSYLRDPEMLGYMRKDALLVPITEKAAKPEQELDPIVDRFLELGWTMGEIRAEFLAAMTKISKDSASSWVNRVLGGAKCFPRHDRERNALLWNAVLPKLWERVERELREYYDRHIGGRSAEAFSDFLKLFKLCSSHSAAEQFIYDQAFALIASGYFTSAHQLIAATIPDHNTRRDLYQRLHLGSARAFIRAVDAHALGIAAAIVQQLSSSDRRELFSPDGFIRAALWDLARERCAPAIAAARKIRKKTERDERLRQINEEIRTIPDAELERYANLVGTVTTIADELGQPIRFRDSSGTYFVDALA
jgi:hypothetical protein